MKIYFIRWALIRRFCAGIIVAGLLAGTYRCLSIPVYDSSSSWKMGIVREVKVNEKLIALTFDDGPSPTYTNKILDLLKQYHAKGTFFVIGEQPEKYPEIIKRELKEGHEIANHMYQHREVYGMPIDELKEDLEHSHWAIYQITGQSMRLYRPTSGYCNEKIYEVACSLNYTVIIWTWGLDSRDWTGLNGRLIARKIIEAVKPGGIILFHDLGGNRNNTIQALEILIPELISQGYQLVTVSKLLWQAKMDAEEF